MLRMEATIKRSLCLFTYGGAKKDMELVPGRVKPIIKESLEMPYAPLGIMDRIME